jgi:peptidoglycan/xylan/chitin deacetylase (PgdA/CDA1 family)
MPLRARLVVAGWVLLYLLLAAGAVTAAVAWAPFRGAGAMAGALFALFALLALDAFHPRVALFMPSLHRIPQRGSEGTIALTFDDGPVRPYTQQILDVLDRYGVKATFFCIGDNIGDDPGLAREIARRGHTLGSHTQTHRSLLLAGAATVAREIDDAQATIRRHCGLEARYFRCPKGYKSPVVAALLRRRGLRLVGYGYPIWDVQNPPPAELVERVLRRARPGDVIVMHDGHARARPGRRDSLVAALPAIIEGLLARGMRPVSLDQACGGGG